MYIESKNYYEVNKLLAISLRDSVRLSIMMDLVRYYCNTPGRTNKEVDSALLYGSRVVLLSETMHSTKFKIECFAFMAICANAQQNVEQAKLYLIQYSKNVQCFVIDQ